MKTIKSSKSKPAKLLSPFGKKILKKAGFKWL